MVLSREQTAELMKEFLDLLVLDTGTLREPEGKAVDVGNASITVCHTSQTSCLTVREAYQQMKKNIRADSNITTSVSLSSLLPILPIRAILPRGPLGSLCPRRPGDTRGPCGPSRAWQAANKLGGVDGDVATSLGRGIGRLGDDD